MQTFRYYNHQGETPPKAFMESLSAPEFDKVAGLHLVLSPFKVMAGRLPSFLTFLAGLGRPFDFYVSMSLTDAGSGPYLYPVRQMSVSFDGRAPVPVNVPIRNAENAPAISAFMCGAIDALPGLLATISPDFHLIAVSCNEISGAPYDTTESTPSNHDETPEQAVANWADLGVTPDVVTAARIAHVQAVAGIIGPDVSPVLSFYNPLLTNIGHFGDGGTSYLAAMKAETDALIAAGRAPLVFYPSLGEGGRMPEVVAQAAQYAGAFAFQMVGGLNDPKAAMLAAMAMTPAPVWCEMSEATLAAVVADGFDGGAFPAA